MAIVLRKVKGTELTYDEADQNFASLFYSASISGNNITFYCSGSTYTPAPSPLVITLPTSAGSKWTASLDGISRESNVQITGSLTLSGVITGSSFNKTGGTSAQVLLADGSVGTAGTGITISGGSITNSAPDRTVALTQGGATTITGTYPNFTISSTDTNTTYTAGNGLTLTSTTFALDNLQKVITGNTTLSNSDNNYTIFINNGSSTVNVTVPSGLTSNFNVGFVQQGSGLVTFVQGSGTTINTATGLKVKGQYYQAFLEKSGSSETYFLLGNVIA
jgi:hypothetical protein